MNESYAIITHGTHVKRSMMHGAIIYGSIELSPTVSLGKVESLKIDF